MSETLRKCARCGLLKPLDDFTIAKSNCLGRSYRCKPCVSAGSMVHYWRKHPGGRKRRAYAPPLRGDKWAEVIARGTLVCRTCGVEKPLSEFRRHPTRDKTYFKRDCKACLIPREKASRNGKREHLRAQHRVRKYGITEQQFARMLEQQQGRCAICNKPLKDGRRVIDHDHVSGAVRGIVHHNCNLVLGNAADDVSALAGAIKYLWEFHRSRGVACSGIDLSQVRVVRLEEYS